MDYSFSTILLHMLTLWSYVFSLPEQNTWTVVLSSVIVNFAEVLY